jgi:hypothetical protein
MKPPLFTAIATGSLLLLVGCSSPGNLFGKADLAPQQEATESAEPMTQNTTEDLQTAEKSETNQADTVAAGNSEILSTILVQITPEKIQANITRADAGPVSFDIRNTGNEPQEVMLLKSALPADQIPTKAGKVDLTSSDVKEVGQLVTNPMPTNRSETLTRTLEPGEYILMAYTPGKIEAAKTQVFTIKPVGI